MLRSHAVCTRDRSIARLAGGCERRGAGRDECAGRRNGACRRRVGWLTLARPAGGSRGEVWPRCRSCGRSAACATASDGASPLRGPRDCSQFSSLQRSFPSVARGSASSPKRRHRSRRRGHLHARATRTARRPTVGARSCDSPCGPRCRGFADPNGPRAAWLLAGSRCPRDRRAPTRGGACRTDCRAAWCEPADVPPPRCKGLHQRCVRRAYCRRTTGGARMSRLHPTFHLHRTFF